MEEIIEIIEEPEEVVEINENVIQEIDPTIPYWVKNITQEDINRWNEGGADLDDYATKEYVNEAIANNITTALEGEY